MRSALVSIIFKKSTKKRRLENLPQEISFKVFYSYFFYLCGPDDERSPHCILHLLDAGIHVLQEEGVTSRHGRHLAERGGSSASESHHTSVGNNNTGRGGSLYTVCIVLEKYREIVLTCFSNEPNIGMLIGA